MQISMDKKYKTRNGWPARVLCIDLKGERPICAAICNDQGFEMLCSFYADGRISNDNNEFDLLEVSIYDDFKKDEPVMAASGDNIWIRRYFSHVQDNVPYCFIEGRTSWSACNRAIEWSVCRRPTPEELAD